MNDLTDPATDTRPLAGVRVIDFSQFVAGPLCTLLLANLGADVIKVESPVGDAYRHYEPLGDGASARLFALNQGKRSVVCDLKSKEGRAFAQKLIASGDVVVHNMPAERAAGFGLDSETIRRTNPRAVVTVVTAFGSDGPKSAQVGYDLIAQAYSGLLMADADPHDEVPRRSGGIPFADITSGLVACISVVAGLANRSIPNGQHFEVSLLAASLLTQIQDLVRIDSSDEPHVDNHEIAQPHDLAQVSSDIRDAAAMEPYYRCYEAADGFFALACLTTPQRRRVLGVLGVEDPWVENPQAVPADSAERALREAVATSFSERFRTAPAAHWIDTFNQASIPAGEVRLLHQLFDDEQVRVNGLVRTVEQSQSGTVDVFGSPFKIDGQPSHAARPAPSLGEHTTELHSEITSSKEHTHVI
jgi:crotonobetainyl-CoA:carnitine CoA-transferase CaiB-like acyl-CoA transferase